GTGLSERDARLEGLEDFVADLVAVADAAGLDRFSIFAASQAVAVAIAFAARFPGRVDRMVLYGGFAEGRAIRRNQPGEIDEPTALALIRSGWGQERSPFMKAFETLFVPDATAAQIDELTRLQGASALPDTAARLRSVVDRFSVVDLLDQVQAPTLVIHAHDDAIQPFAQGQKLAAGIPGARFVRLDSRNHVPLPQDPAWSRMMAELERFLRG
ncbi:MAG TPA: alpha/beta hydrolase, partial [Paracoccaceae bacterium]|nr:alpha/beta hydrolase [Paracoccaceae bacterium]